MNSTIEVFSKEEYLSIKELVKSIEKRKDPEEKLASCLFFASELNPDKWLIPEYIEDLTNTKRKENYKWQKLLGETKKIINDHDYILANKPTFGYKIALAPEAVLEVGKSLSRGIGHFRQFYKLMEVFKARFSVEDLKNSSLKSYDAYQAQIQFTPMVKGVLVMMEDAISNLHKGGKSVFSEAKQASRRPTEKELNSYKVKKAHAELEANYKTAISN